MFAPGRRWTSRGSLFAVGSITIALMGAAAACKSGQPRSPRPTAQESAARLRARELVRQMTFEEKATYIGGDREFFIRAVPRLGIPEIKMADGPVGCRNWGPSTAYPAPIGLAASFDVELAREVGASVARDCRARGVRVLLAPGVNMQRSPLSGRNFEYWGEDPLLAAWGSVAFTRGVQEGGVLATAKHFVLNDQEWDRTHVDSHVSERALREIYLRPFEALVKDAKVGAVMTAYNLFEGEFCSQSDRLIDGILREEWGFDGLVMSDWWAVRDTRRTYIGGVDLEMPSGTFLNAGSLGPLRVEIGEEALDRKVENILTPLIGAGFFEKPAVVAAPVNDPKSRAIARKAARESVVLLKNEMLSAGGRLLPLNRSRLQKVAVVGPNAHPAVTSGSGSAYVTPVDASSLFEALGAAMPHASVVHHPGVQETASFARLGEPVFVDGVRQEIFTNRELEGEPLLVREVDRVIYRPDKNPDPEIPHENVSMRFSGEIEISEAGSVLFMASSDDGVRVFVDEKLILSDWTDHPERMNERTLELSAGHHKVVIEYYQGGGGAGLEFGWVTAGQRGALSGEAELIQTVEGADVVVVAVGYGQFKSTGSLGVEFDPYWPPGHARSAGVVEAENDDRAFLLPAAQMRTLEVLTGLGVPTVVVLYAGGGVDFTPWIDGVGAVLWAGYPGTEGSEALSEILLGDVNPSGRLPVTFAVKNADHPAASSYDVIVPLDPARMPSLESLCSSTALESARRFDGEKGKPSSGSEGLWLTPYCEDVFVGYRGFDRWNRAPLFPFGYGLSYSTFEYAGLGVQGDGPWVDVRVHVSNVSAINGAEVIQIYVEPPVGQWPRPSRVLAGFRRMELAAGSGHEVALRLDPKAFAIYAPGRGFLIPSGRYGVVIARDERTPLLEASVTMGELVLD